MGDVCWKTASAERRNARNFCEEEENKEMERIKKRGGVVGIEGNV